MAEQNQRQQRSALVIVQQPEDAPLQPAGNRVRDFTNEQTVGSVPMLLMDPFLTQTVCWPILAYHSAAKSTPYVQIPLLLRAIATLFTDKKWIQCLESTSVVSGGQGTQNVLGIEWFVPSFVQESVIETGLPRFRDTLPGWTRASVRQGKMPAKTLFGASRDEWPIVVKWRTYSSDPSEIGGETMRTRATPLVTLLSAEQQRRYNAALDSLGDDRENTYDAIVHDIRHAMRSRFRFLNVTLWSFPRNPASARGDGGSDLRIPAPLFLVRNTRNISYRTWLSDFEKVVGDEQKEEEYIRQSSVFGNPQNVQRAREGDIIFVQEPLSWPEGAVKFFTTHGVDGSDLAHVVPADPRVLYYIDRFLLAYNRVYENESNQRGTQWLDNSAEEANDTFGKTERQLTFLKHLAPVAHLLRMTPHVPLPLGFSESGIPCSAATPTNNAQDIDTEFRRYAKVLTTQISGVPLITWALERRTPRQWRSVLFQILWTLCAFDTLSISFGKLDAQSIVVNTEAGGLSYAIYQVSSDTGFLVPLTEQNVCFTQFHTVTGVPYNNNNTERRASGQSQRRRQSQAFLQSIRAQVGSPPQERIYVAELFGGLSGPQSVVSKALNDAFSDSLAPLQFDLATRETILAIHKQFTQYSVFSKQTSTSQTLLNEFFTQMLTPERSVLVQFYECSLFEQYLVRLPLSELAKHAMQTETLPVFAMPRTLDARTNRKRTRVERALTQLQRQERRLARRVQRDQAQEDQGALLPREQSQVVSAVQQQQDDRQEQEQEEEEEEEELIPPSFVEMEIADRGLDTLPEMTDAEIRSFLERLDQSRDLFEQDDGQFAFTTTELPSEQQQQLFPELSAPNPSLPGSPVSLQTPFETLPSDSANLFELPLQQQPRSASPNPDLPEFRRESERDAWLREMLQEDDEEQFDYDAFLQ